MVKNIANKKNKELKDKHREWLLGNKPHHQKMIENSHKKRYRKTSIEIEIENYLIENNMVQANGVAEEVKVDKIAIAEYFSKENKRH